MPDQKVKDIRIAKAVHAVNSTFADDFDFNQLAESLNLSPSRLRQLFKEEMGMSFKKYLRQVRMKRARHLLKTTLVSIHEIAEQVGIHDISHFVRDFEQQFGLSPRKYRMKYYSPKEK